MSPPAARLADTPRSPPTEIANTDAQGVRPTTRDARRKAILDIARDSFLEHGFAATSMSAIAARLGGSKGTLYNYFASKEELFSAVVQEECEGEFIAMTSFQPSDSVRDSLLRFGRRFLRYVLSDSALGFHRLLAAESGRFPALGRLFYEAGPERTLARISAFLREHMEAGRLRPGDPEQAASFLSGLLKSNLHHRRVWNVGEPISQRMLDAHVDAAVDVFLRGLATGAGA